MKLRLPRSTQDLAECGENGLSHRWMAVFFVISVALIFSRRPQDLIHPQFFAEDGNVWFAQAYDISWLRSLTFPQASYFQVLPRLAAGLALWVPLRLAPLVMNLVGAFIQALPGIALLSRRCSTWGSLPVRMCLAGLYLANPNAPEIHVVATNAQWHFALLLVLLAFSQSPKTVLGKTGDIAAFVLGAFSGPFCIALIPALLCFWWFKRERWSLILVACIAIGIAFQVHTILYGKDYIPPAGTGILLMPGRIQAERLPLGATPSLLVRILGGDIVLNSIIGVSNVSRTPLFVLLPVLLLGIAVVIFGLRWGPIGFRMLSLMTLILTVASLKSPDVFGSVNRWTALVGDTGMRYYFLPSIVFLWSAVYCATRASIKTIRLTGLAVLLIVTLGAIRRWEYPRWPDYRFNDSVDRLHRAKPGEHVLIPIYPAPWTMTLDKHRWEKP